MYQANNMQDWKSEDLLSIPDSATSVAYDLASHVTSLYLGLPVCKMGLMIPLQLWTVL